MLFLHFFSKANSSAGTDPASETLSQELQSMNVSHDLFDESATGASASLSADERDDELLTAAGGSLVPAENVIEDSGAVNMADIGIQVNRGKFHRVICLLKL
jgi:hypothetical protein